ncbi:MAG: nucleoid-associated protein [Cytophagaceae bacterium]|jgi:hypothetical protein|nr:nucleoid-associated protein [Cytophagaceae bacterium]
MIKIEDLTLRNLVVHFVGNQQKEEELRISKSEMHLNDTDLESLLMKYFLSPFKNPEYYHLFHEAELDLNELYAYCSKIFADPDCFYLQSISIAKHLYENSVHPKVKGGELYIVYLENIQVENEITDAIGIFKSESKETYLRVSLKGENYEINSDHGININKLDKGCVIFNLDKEKGFRVCVSDSTNQWQEARYWKDEFIRVKPREDSYYHTQQYMQLCKGFIDEKLKDSFEVNKADEVDLMNKSVKFFKEKEVFDWNEFSQEIIQQPEVIDAFKEYKDQFQKERSVHIYDEFDISKGAVKNTTKIFKSVIKLDRNFSLYIHGNQDHIERGFDDVRGMNYYQLFFKEEK